MKCDPREDERGNDVEYQASHPAKHIQDRETAQPIVRMGREAVQKSGHPDSSIVHALLRQIVGRSAPTDCLALELPGTPVHLYDMSPRLATSLVTKKFVQLWMNVAKKTQIFIDAILCQIHFSLLGYIWNI